MVKLGCNQVAVLEYLKRRGGQRMYASWVAEALQMGRGKVVSVLRSLERRGFVEGDETADAIMRWRIIPAGAEVLRERARGLPCQACGGHGRVRVAGTAGYSYSGGDPEARCPECNGWGVGQ